MTRTYEQTHPWLSFSLDLTNFDYRMWMALGEASSKCNHIAGVPLAPQAAAALFRLFLVKGALATTAIEGNTLSEEEAEAVLTGAVKLPPSQQYLADEVKNVIDAVNVLTTRIADGGPKEITVELLKEMNSNVLRGLDVGEDVTPGHIREHSVVVGRYRCAPPEDLDYLLEKFCNFLNEFPTPGDAKGQFCIIKAVVAHLYFVWIHPFGDGNGRTARLLELYILLCAGFPQPTGHLLSNHYNRTRQRYYERLDAAVRGQSEVVAFLKYSLEGFVDGLRDQIAMIREQQMTVAWINYIHEQFHDRNSPTDVRRRHVVLALSMTPGSVPTTKVTQLTPQVAVEYANKTAKTVVRDINWLIETELVVRVKGGIKANRDKILAFLPWRALDDLEEVKAAA